MILNIINGRKHQSIIKNQLEQVAKKCRKMRHQIATSNTFLIGDDEKYSIFSNDEMSQNVSFDKEHGSDHVKYKTKEDYPKNGFRLASKGISNTFFWYDGRSSHYHLHLH